MTETMSDAKRIGRSPAFPTGTGLDGILSGLTKREFFAAMAMQGILANSGAPPSRVVVEAAAVYADALLEELTK